MVSIKQIRELLTALNIKGEQKQTEYILSYNYTYSRKLKKVYLRTRMTKYVKNIITTYTNLKSEIETIQYINDELKKLG